MPTIERQAREKAEQKMAAARAADPLVAIALTALDGLAKLYPDYDLPLGFARTIVRELREKSITPALTVAPPAAAPAARRRKTTEPATVDAPAPPMLPQPGPSEAPRPTTATPTKGLSL